MSQVRPEQRGLVSGMLGLSRNLGLVTGASLMGAVFAAGAGDKAMADAKAVSTGMRATFGLAVILIMMGLGLVGMSRWTSHRH